jgi:hypothetical protein
MSKQHSTQRRNIQQEDENADERCHNRRGGNPLPPRTSRGSSHRPDATEIDGACRERDRSRQGSTENDGRRRERRQEAEGERRRRSSDTGTPGYVEASHRHARREDRGRRRDGRGEVGWEDAWYRGGSSGDCGACKSDAASAAGSSSAKRRPTQRSHKHASANDGAPSRSASRQLELERAQIELQKLRLERQQREMEALAEIGMEFEEAERLAEERLARAGGPQWGVRQLYEHRTPQPADDMEDALGSLLSAVGGGIMAAMMPAPVMRVVMHMPDDDGPAVVAPPHRHTRGVSKPAIIEEVEDEDDDDDDDEATGVGRGRVGGGGGGGGKTKGCASGPTIEELDDGPAVDGLD